MTNPKDFLKKPYIRSSMFLFLFFGKNRKKKKTGIGYAYWERIEIANRKKYSLNFYHSHYYLIRVSVASSLNSTSSLSRVLAPTICLLPIILHSRISGTSPFIVPLPKFSFVWVRVCTFLTQSITGQHGLYIVNIVLFFPDDPIYLQFCLSPTTVEFSQ